MLSNELSNFNTNSFGDVINSDPLNPVYNNLPRQYDNFIVPKLYIGYIIYISLNSIREDDYFLELDAADRHPELNGFNTHEVYGGHEGHESCNKCDLLGLSFKILLFVIFIVILYYLFGDCFYCSKKKSKSKLKNNNYIIPTIIF
jgi:hypothetical protein